MRIRTVVLVACLMALLSPGATSAQVTDTIGIGPNTERIDFAWDAPTSTDPIAGFEIVFANTIQTGMGLTGQQLKVIPVADPTARTLQVPREMFPADTVREFYASIRTRTTAGVLSLHSNALLFRRAAIPGAPGNFRGVVAEGQVSSAKPGSGVETDGSSIRTSGVSIHESGQFESNWISSSPTLAVASGQHSSNQVPRGRSESRISSLRPK